MRIVRFEHGVIFTAIRRTEIRKEYQVLMIRHIGKYFVAVLGVCSIGMAGSAFAATSYAPPPHSSSPYHPPQESSQGPGYGPGSSSANHHKHKNSMAGPSTQSGTMGQPQPGQAGSPPPAPNGA